MGQEPGEAIQDKVARGKKKPHRAVQIWGKKTPMMLGRDQVKRQSKADFTASRERLLI